jgi:uncharacterized membrane protein YvlD (DUF360 family)
VVRILINIAIKLLANAVGLGVAAWLLEDMTVTTTAFLIAVGIFTVVEVLIDPLLTSVAIRSAPALRGSVALVTTFVGLVVTTLLTDGLSISGATTWIVANLIVWLAALIAALLLPLFMVKKAATNRADGN